MNIGRLFLSSDWSSDCHWDFTDAESGDEYRDFFSIATVKRKPYPKGLHSHGLHRACVLRDRAVAEVKEWVA